MTKRVLAVFGWPLLPVDILDPRTARRVYLRALQLWRTRAFDLLFISGGYFLPQTLQTRAWCDIVWDQFVHDGVCPEHMRTDHDSRDTYDNIANTLRALRAEGIRDPEIVVCTHAIHGRRVQHTFNVAHGVDVQIEPVSMPLTAGEQIEQWLYVLYHHLDRRGTGSLRRRIVRARERMR